MPVEIDREKKPDILVVDDTPANLNVLSEMLREHGYRVRPVPSGALALKAATAQPPDLILLDVNMPEMDGYEVCAQLKGSETLNEIPVIFISALNETVDKVKAFRVGGLDYITKPFQFEEVEARVNTHLKLSWQQAELEQSYAKLRQLEVLRDNLTHMIIHDMRSPLTAITGAFDIMSYDTHLPESEQSLVHLGQDASRKLAEMVNSMLDISRMEAGKMPLRRERCDGREIVEAAVALFAPSLEKINLLTDLPAAPVLLDCDSEIMRRVLTNLIANALKFTPKGGTVTVGVGPMGLGTCFEVSDTGEGIPAEYHDTIFAKFGQVEVRQRQGWHASGLGLTFCKLAAETHGGQIALESKMGHGTTFRVTLPAENERTET